MGLWDRAMASTVTGPQQVWDSGGSGLQALPFSPCPSLFHPSSWLYPLHIRLWVCMGYRQSCMSKTFWVHGCLSFPSCLSV